MIKIKKFKCMNCSTEYLPSQLDEPVYSCPKCEEIEIGLGILEIEYDYSSVKIDKLPNTGNVLDFIDFFPVDSKYFEDTLQMPYTPLYKSKNHKNCYVKDEGRQPTASLKDRASLIGAAKALELGYSSVCAASTGNAASSLSGFAAKNSLKCYIFVPEKAPKGKIAQLKIYGSKVTLFPGKYDDVWEHAVSESQKNNWYNRNCAYNPYLVEGKKSVSFEIFNQLGKVPDNIIVSIGDGCITSGIYKGFYDLIQTGIVSKMPRIISVQSEKCAPMRDYFESSKFEEWKNADTVADSISVGKPRNRLKAIRAVTNSEGFITAVSDKEILEAMKLQAQDTGVFGEPAGTTAYAGYLKILQEKKISEEDITVVINTGNGLKDIDSALKAAE